MNFLEELYYLPRQFSIQHSFLNQQNKGVKERIYITELQPRDKEIIGRGWRRWKGKGRVGETEGEGGDGEAELILFLFLFFFSFLIFLNVKYFFS